MWYRLFSRGQIAALLAQSVELWRLTVKVKKVEKFLTFLGDKKQFYTFPTFTLSPSYWPKDCTAVLLHQCTSCCTAKVQKKKSENLTKPASRRQEQARLEQVGSQKVIWIPVSFFSRLFAIVLSTQAELVNPQLCSEATCLVCAIKI